MSVEVIAIIIAAASLFVTIGGGLFAGFAWMLRHMDEKFARVDEKFDQVADGFDKISTQLSGLQAELNDVKVSVARLEGPQQRLILPR